MVSGVGDFNPPLVILSLLQTTMVVHAHKKFDLRKWQKMLCVVEQTWFGNMKCVLMENQ